MCLKPLVATLPPSGKTLREDQPSAEENGAQSWRVWVNIPV